MEWLYVRGCVGMRGHMYERVCYERVFVSEHMWDVIACHMAHVTVTRAMQNGKG